jgi:hypothetical protein
VDGCNIFQSYILIHLVCPSVNLGHEWELGTNWARTGQGLGTGIGGTGHGLGIGTGMLGTGELGPGEGHDTGKLGTGGLGTDWARAGSARLDYVRTSRVPTSVS